MIDDQGQMSQQSFTIAEWCSKHRISRAKFYLMLKSGDGPAIYNIDKNKIGKSTMVRISAEADRNWMIANSNRNPT